MAKKITKKEPADEKAKAPAKKAGKEAGAKKVASAAKKEPAATVKAVAPSVVVTPAKGDIVVAYNKYYLVHTSSKTNQMLIGVHLHMIEICMQGANFHRDIAWTDITAIYKDAGYRG